MIKAIIFDLYDTILDDVFFDFNTGLEALYNIAFKDECSVEDFLTFAMSFIPLYQNRSITNKEISFLNDEYKVYCSQLEVEPDVNIDDMEYSVMCAMQKEELKDSVKTALKKLKEKGIVMYAHTNSIFRSQCHKRLLSEAGLGEYFKDVFSSVDFGMRKPDLSFFEYAVQNVLSENPDIKREEVLYAGNDYEADIKGALSIGLKTLWYNVNNEKNIENLPLINIQNMEDLLVYTDKN